MKRLPVRVLMILLCMMLCCVSVQAKTVPYTAELDALTGIYQGPGVDYGYARKVGADGVYTIVEEAYDEYGNLWGRLKSGAGWVMLEEQAKPVFSETPYTTRLDADEMICKGPGFSYGYVRDVGANGVYTIVEEAIGEDGFLWGRLKSGLGWVRLSDTPVTEQEFFAIDYTIELGAWVPMYSAPSEEQGVFCGIIGEDGVYTIITETLDALGNTWGELKSGEGWINLNYVRTMGNPLMTAYPAESLIGEKSDYTAYIQEDSEYTTWIAFRANDLLLDVKLTSLEYAEEGYKVVEELHKERWIAEEAYLVAGLVFYGDMTTYGISFVDSEGEERFFAVSLSGMDGSIVMNEYIQ